MSERVAAAARAWLGTPYRHQASVPGAGCDCLGLVRGVFRDVVGPEPWAVPPYRAGWRGDAPGLEEAARRFLWPAALGAGRVVLFRVGRVVRHCGIMVTDARFVHAQERIGVVEADLTEGWRGRVAGVFAFPDSPSPRRCAPPLPRIAGKED